MKRRGYQMSIRILGIIIALLLIIMGLIYPV